MPRNKPQPQNMTSPASPKVEYPSSAFDWQPLPDGLIALIIHVPGQVLLFPMTDKYAAELNQRRLEHTIAAPTAALT